MGRSGTMREHLRVIVADDNPVVRAGLAALLSGQDGIDVAAQAADGREAYEAAVRHRPDAVLLDVRMPGVDGLAALPGLVRLAPVLMTTYSRESDIVHQALRLGACGYLVHGEFTAAQLVDAVRDTALGRAHFTHTASSALLAAVRGQYAPATHEVAMGGGTFPETPSHPQANVAHSLLSQREVEVMDLIASGMTNQQIAAACFISQKTVKNHINRIFAKLHAGSRGQAIALWHAERSTPHG
ncbi:response regulator [Streptomyces sp. NPDC015131]|uniref:response regulator n=1 Tax=Streptomyces sp. NPDC015131 TaxID=3364941 RepID=UPI0036FE7C38